MSREARLARTFVDLADTLVDDFDVVDLLTTLANRCVEVLDIDAAGIMLIDPDGELRLMTSSSDAVRVVERFELQRQEGPCFEAFRTGQAAADQDFAAPDDRWPGFAAVASSMGFRAADARPMRLRRRVVGALNLFRTQPGSLEGRDAVAAQALADIATIAILQHRMVEDAQTLNDQLHHALSTRIVIEQAKGMVAERKRIDVDQAFALIRRHARNHNRRLAELAGDLVRGDIEISSLDPPRRPVPRTDDRGKRRSPNVPR